MSAANNATNQGTSIPHEVNKLALVVGVNNSSIAPYRSTLQHAEQDAQDMASLLEQPECSFSLLTPALTGEETTSGNIKQRVVELIKKRTDKDFLLFYYAGHAVPIDNDIYFLTSDFQEENLAFDPDLYLSMRWLWKVLYQSVGAGRVLLILDCCYAGNMVETKDDPLKIDLRKLLDEWNTGSNGKDQKNCLRLILTATGYNDPAQEQDGHGLMTGFLLKALRGEADEALDKNGHVDIRYLHKYLQEKMPKEQAPDLSGKFGPYDCILASYPERAAQRRSQHKPVRGAERPQSYIPFPRNPLFQPRPGEFEHLEMLLSRENTEQPARIGLVGVTGMGGIGKTQLAVELAYRLQEQHRFPDGLFWTPATGKNVFEWQHSMAELAFNANYLPPNDDPASPENEARRARHFCRYLSNHPDALLILDNVEEPELVISALPTLAGGNLACSILYTSRMTQTPQGVVPHAVERLSEKASLHLLLEETRLALLSEALTGSRSSEACAARSVCSVVGYMPLALVHLRSFLVQDRQVSLCRLLEVLDSRGISGVAAKVTETFRLSWEKVRTEEARQIFLLASYFPEATPIPFWLLGLASELGENGDIFEPLGQARFELLELSLLEELSNEQVRLHPLVRAFGRQVVREMADQGMNLRQEADQQLVEAGTDLNWLEGQARKQGYRTCLKHIQEMLDYARLLNINTSVEALQRIERLLDQESYLLAGEQWWPKRVSGLFHQHLSNRAQEIGQPVKAKQAPVRWVHQIKPSGAMDRSLLRIFAGHTNSVSSVAFSPDGTLVLTGSSDARLWDTSTGKELTTFHGHTRWVSSVAFSPDGTLILTGSLDKTARLWDTSTGKALSSFHGHTDWVSSVAFSPDGTLVLTGSLDKTARLWDTSTGKALSSFHGHTSSVSSVAFSPDGALLLTGSSDGTARLWDTSTGKALSSFHSHMSPVSSVAFSPDGTLLLTGSWDGTARLWDTSTGKALSSFHGHTSSVDSVAFSPDGTLVLTGSSDGTARLWDTSTGKALSSFHGHTSPVRSVAFSPDGTLLLTGSLDKTARLWDTSTGKALSSFHGHTSPVESVAFSPDGTLLLTGSLDKTARLWDTSTGKALSSFHGHTSSVSSVAFSPDGTLLLTGSLDKTARLWDTSTGKALSSFRGHTNLVRSVAFSPDGTLLLTGSSDKTACLWDTSTGKAHSSFHGHTDSVSSVAFSPDGTLVLTGSSDHTTRLWDTSTGKELTTFQGHTSEVDHVTFSPSGSIALTCDAKGWVFFWRIDDLEAKDPFAIYVAYYPVVAVHWQDKTHVILADNGGPRNYPYFYHLELEGMG